MRGGQREKVAISNRLPRFRIRACSALVRFEIERSGISFLLPLLFEEGLPFFIPSRSRVLCRGKYFFPKFHEGSILQLKRFLARLPVSRGEQPNQHFSTSAPAGPWKGELGFIWNPPPRIRIRVDSSRFLSVVLSMWRHAKKQVRGSALSQFKGFEHGQDLKRNVRRPQTV